MALPRGYRNNNPGNIIKSGIQWRGEKESLDESKFEVFDTPLNGIRACALLLLSYQTKHGCKTVRQTINRWAPPVENDTGAYVKAVAAAIGVGPDTNLDFHDPQILYGLTVAIINHELGKPPPGGWYPQQMVIDAVHDALGLPATQPAAPIEDHSTQYEETPMPSLTDTLSQAAPVVGTMLGGPVGGLIGGLASALIQAFAPAAQQKISKEVARHTDKATGDAVANVLTSGVVDLAKEFTKKDDPVQATAAALSDPVIVQKIEAATVTKLDELRPMLDDLARYQKEEWDADEASRAAAASRAMMDPGVAAIRVRQVTFTQYAIGISTIVVAVLLGAQIYLSPEHTPSEALMVLLTALVTVFANTFRTQNDYVWGSSHGSDAKNESLAQLAARRPKS